MLISMLNAGILAFQNYSLYYYDLSFLLCYLICLCFVYKRQMRKSSEKTRGREQEGKGARAELRAEMPDSFSPGFHEPLCDSE